MCASLILVWSFYSFRPSRRTPPNPIQSRRVILTNVEMSFHSSIVEAIKKTFGHAVWTNGQLDPDPSLYFCRKVYNYLGSESDGEFDDCDGLVKRTTPVKNIGVQGKPGSMQNVCWVLNEDLHLDVRSQKVDEVDMQYLLQGSTLHQFCIDNDGELDK